MTNELPVAKRLKVVTGHAGFARFLATCSPEPTNEIRRRDLAPIRSPYSYSPSWMVYEMPDEESVAKVFIVETSHGRHEVFEVPSEVKLYAPGDEIEP